MDFSRGSPIVSWIGEGREPYVFAHQPDNLDSPDLARQLHQAVRAQLPQLKPLPDPPEIDEPEQTSMF